MADYSQPDAVTKRVRFFDGQFLQDQDFVDEQRYHLDRQRRPLRLLGYAGIAEGLQVAAVAATPFALAVSAGTAIDALGRQLVLPGPVTLTLGPGFARQQNIAVVIAWQEIDTDVAQTGGRSARRFDETPVVAAVASDGTVAVAPSDASTTLDRVTVPLATISVGDQGEIVVSAAAGVPAGMTLAELTVTGNLGIGTATPRARLDVAGGGGSSAVDVIANGRFKSAGDDGGLWVNEDRFIGGLGNRIGLFNTTATWGLVMGPTGDIGIGTIDPENAEHWQRTLDILAPTSTKLSVRTSDKGVDGRIMAHSQGIYGAPIGMLAGTRSNHPLSLITSGACRVTVTGDGQVGVGTGSPENAEGWARTLDVFGPDNAKLSVRTSTIEARVMVHPNFWASPAGMIVGTKSPHAVTLATGGTQRLTVTADGHVAVGAPSPENVEGWQRTLDILAPTSTKVSVRTTDKGVDGRIMAHSQGIYGAPIGMLAGTRSSHALSLITSGASRLTVTADGLVGIATGNQTPAARLEIGGDPNAGGGQQVDLVVSGRLKSRSPVGGLWVGDNRAFIGASDPNTLGFYFDDSGWQLQVTRQGDVTVANGKLVVTKGDATVTAGGLTVEKDVVVRSGNLRVSKGDLYVDTGGIATDGNINTLGNVHVGKQLSVVGSGGTNIDLDVAGRLRSFSDDGGLWVKDNRFIGGTGDQVGFWQSKVGWGLTMAPSGDVTIATGSLAVKGDLHVGGNDDSAFRVRTYELRVKNGGHVAVAWSVTVDSDFTQVFAAFAALSGFSLWDNSGNASFHNWGAVADAQAIPQHCFARVTRFTSKQVFGECFCTESASAGETDNTVLFNVVVIGRKV